MQVLAVLDAWDFHDEDKVNVRGLGIFRAIPSALPASVSSPHFCTKYVGATRGGALKTMCIGGGQGLAALIEGVCIVPDGSRRRLSFGALSVSTRNVI